MDPELEGDNLNHHLALIRSLAARTNDECCVVGSGSLGKSADFWWGNLIVLKSQLPRQDGCRDRSLSSGGQGVHALPQSM